MEWPPEETSPGTKSREAKAKLVRCQKGWLGPGQLRLGWIKEGSPRKLSLENKPLPQQHSLPAPLGVTVTEHTPFFARAI